MMLATTIQQPGLVPAVFNYVQLELHRTSRNRRYLMTAIVFPVMFYALFTGVLQGGTADPTAGGGLVWKTYYMVSMAAYGAIGAALGGAIVIATERRSGWTRLLRTTPLPPVGYVAGKLIVSYVVTVPSVGLVLAAGAFLNHVALAPATWAQIYLSLLLGALPFAALGLLLGYLFDASSAQGGMMITYFALAILGGLWVPVSNMADVLVTIAHVLPSYHLANLGWQALAGGAPDPVDVVVLAAYAVGIGGLVLWRYRADELRARG
jgi:ABC-2 type transport system permease protein